MDTKRTPEETLRALEEKVHNGLEMTDEEGMTYLMALIDHLSHRQPEDMQENMEAKQQEDTEIMKWFEELLENTK